MYECVKNIIEFGCCAFEMWFELKKHWHTVRRKLAHTDEVSER